jgi:hypothetical protein
MRRAERPRKAQLLRNQSPGAFLVADACSEQCRVGPPTERRRGVRCAQLVRDRFALEQCVQPLDKLFASCPEVRERVEIAYTRSLRRGRKLTGWKGQGRRPRPRDRRARADKGQATRARRVRRGCTHRRVCFLRSRGPRAHRLERRAHSGRPRAPARVIRTRGVRRAAGSTRSHGSTRRARSLAGRRTAVRSRPPRVSQDHRRCRRRARRRPAPAQPRSRPPRAADHRTALSETLGERAGTALTVSVPADRRRRERARGPLVPGSRRRAHGTR